MKNIRCNLEYDSGNFIIIDDDRKMITEISTNVIELVNNLKYIVDKNVATNCNDAIDFYNDSIETAIKNKIETNNKEDYSKSHISTSDYF